MKFYVFLGFCLISGLSYASTQERADVEQLQVSINRMQYLGHDVVKLADIAEVSGSNQALVDQVRQVTLDWPATGNRLTAGEITTQLRARFSDFGPDWQVKGLNQVFLKQCWSLSVKKLERAAQQSISAWLDANNARLRSVRFIDERNLLCVPQNVERFEVKNNIQGTLFSKHRITFNLDSGEDFSVVMQLALEQLRPVLRVNKQKEESINDLDVEWLWQEVTHLKLSQQRLDINNLIARRNLQSGQVLDENNTRTKPLVEQGEQLQFKMQSGALFITGKAKALGEGQLGDEINIMLESSNQAIKAKIVQKGVVIVSQ
ncbi:flagellar basal body P-ring formation chaperone FlgA [Pseudoalteromonas byunsanensis]|uniref:Flagella basal body P-ring formation protein FlgA n=1 Tax=Pseudoalteromonas byunsanensis TaxID=327939 RepID=A0A1S1N7R3_9GAMM|nr:flagellar basal body P-ring formation chaperone FlgA [Pseudoalteromonas byunsanensis]OHU97332.1 flagella basal body P-ring formation protein FlgA [Pseudoalteromonas byunsanensis]